MVLIPIAIVLLVGAFVFSSGTFNIDEFVQLAGAQAFLSSGSFAVPNGPSDFSSPDLALWILIAGPHGLTPQYPIGPSVLGAPFLAVFGQRGLMLINVLAGIGTLFALWRLGKRHFGGTAVALVSVLLLLCATFWVEYVFAIWPHSMSALCVTVAMLLALDCFDAEPPADRKFALGAGAVIGVGLLFRTDTILALGAIGLAAMLLAKRPFRMLTFVGLGLAPFVALDSAANYAKFGTFNPLSYGQTGGNTTLSSHLAAIAALALVSLLLAGARFAKWRPGRRDYLIGVLAVAVIVLASPAARDFAERYLAGAWALLVDSTTIHDPRPGVHPLPGGVLSFWGLWKKALGQSMPWLGILLLAVHVRKDEPFRRSQWVVFILAAVWSLPFFMMAWHGGMGSNMRYLLPVVPLLCALAARYLVDLIRPMARGPRVLASGALAGAIAVGLWTVLHPTGDGGAEQILSKWMLAVIAGLALLSGLRWAGQGVVRIACAGAVGAGLAASAFFMVADMRQTQDVRSMAEAYSVANANLPGHTVAYVPAPFITRWTFRPGHIAAMPDSLTLIPDDALIEQALARRYRVIVWPHYVGPALRARYGPRLVRSGIMGPDGELWEIVSPAN